MGDYDNILNTAIEEAEERGLRKGLEQGIEEGIEKGIEQGIEKGIEEEKERVALKMKSSGLSAETIAEVTGLPLERIQSLESQPEN